MLMTLALRLTRLIRLGQIRFLTTPTADVVGGATLPECAFTRGKCAEVHVAHAFEAL